MASTFHGPFDAHIAIPAPQCGPGGTMNFNFGSRVDGQRHELIPFSTVPFAPDPDFVDRSELVAWVRDKCAGPGARAALVGLGGVGKSQLALQYAHSIRDTSPHTFVFWVHASTHARFEEAYRDIADQLQLPGRSDPKANVLRLVSDWLQDKASGRWVMVVDSVDDAEAFFPLRKRQQSEANASAQTPLATYLPQSRNGAVLITSRSKDAANRLVGGYNKIKEVLTMNEGKGLQLLRNKLRDPPLEESAVELLQALDCIPLAVSQAAAYINRRARMTAARYLDEYWKNDKKRESLLNWDADELHRDMSASNSVVTTWQMSFEQIQRERRSAAELLSLMSFSNPQGIPESTLRTYSTGKAEANAAGDQEDPDAVFDEDLDTLQAYSLVSITANNDTCEMHALVQFCTRIWLSSFSNAAQWEQEFVALMARELPSGEYENWGKCQQLLPHVEPLFKSEPAAKEAVEAWAQVLTNAAWYLCLRGNYERAELIARKASATTERLYGINNELTLEYINNLANVLHDRGKYEAAELLHRQALEEREKRFGPFNGSTMTSVNNLANAVRIQRKYKEAEQLYRRALQWCEVTLSSRHRITLRSMSNLAVVLRAQNLYSESESMHQRALEGRESTLGRFHIDKLASINNLAVVTQYQGKSLEAKVQTLGAHHPDALTTVNNLATVLQLQGTFEEAEKLYRQALKGREEEIGIHHPDTLLSMGLLASALQDQGKRRQKKLSRQAPKGYKNGPGEWHPNTLTSVFCLAYLLHTLRRYTEAAELYQQACDRRTQQLGPDYPHTVACRNYLATLQQGCKR
ncbi:TPR-like protein [Setomelanomma holmii]|uniref:TPR-like protein n=1 Tax=Setomelanomma holmii TaxID=210430 RepID=A0A9P4H943_9PLEO|nr:TPR-like protein [Setomelanomma holmii]